MRERERGVKVWTGTRKCVRERERGIWVLGFGLKEEESDGLFVSESWGESSSRSQEERECVTCSARGIWGPLPDSQLAKGLAHQHPHLLITRQYIITITLFPSQLNPLSPSSNSSLYIHCSIDSFIVNEFVNGASPIRVTISFILQFAHTHTSKCVVLIIIEWNGFLSWLSRLK